MTEGTGLDGGHSDSDTPRRVQRRDQINADLHQLWVELVKALRLEQIAAWVARRLDRR